MNRKARIVHIFTFVALVANMFAPLIAMEMESVSAASMLRSGADPTVSYDTGVNPDDVDVVTTGPGEPDDSTGSDPGDVGNPVVHDGGEGETGSADAPGSGAVNPEADGNGDTPSNDDGGIPVSGGQEVPQPTAVMPNAPTTYALQCVDGVGYTSAVADPAWTEGVTYRVTDNGSGTVSVTATLTDSTLYAWDTNSMAAHSGQ